MQKLALTTAGIVFLLVAILHLLRLIFQWQAKIGKLTIPLWLSMVGLIVASLLAIWMFKAM